VSAPFAPMQPIQTQCDLLNSWERPQPQVPQRVALFHLSMRRTRHIPIRIRLFCCCHHVFFTENCGGQTFRWRVRTRDLYIVLHKVTGGRVAGEGGVLCRSGGCNDLCIVPILGVVKMTHVALLYTAHMRSWRIRYWHHSRSASQSKWVI
jgi:hypothetical protein